MSSNHDQKLLFLVMGSSGAMHILGPPSFSPEWLNDALSTMFLFLILISLGLLGVLHFHKNSKIAKQVYPILIVVAVLGFATGAFLSSQYTPENKIVLKATDPVKIDKVAKTPPPQKNKVKTPTATKPTPQRVFTPRTPKELMDIAETETERDANKHKGAWVNIEGPVLDIGETSVPSFSLLKKGEYYIRIEVGSNPSPHKLFPNKKRINLYLKNKQWKGQVDKIRRGDWISAIAIVRRVSKMRIDVIDGEIVSVSGPSKGRK